ncbi:hypothetical protein DYBT9623_00107 [Dyadobacter sp. CECT 9623]|uniref:Uncharacterized protein n=1 Tax=Dyadobacter linearis TaxID=2823330 RepID=A0ABM8UIQ0_9BACT|nr:hypothetical protein [Dyadobacter sp. CECT 9623]CAG5067387.1 hypothetical protein DYBT9623_00107 [Dyadobacter sp. CECT 9623]
MEPVKFKAKEDGSEVLISPSEVVEIIPDADMRFCLVILKNEEKLFIQGTRAGIREQLNIEN